MILQLLLLLIRQKTLHRSRRTADCTKESIRKIRKEASSRFQFKMRGKGRDNVIVGLGNTLCEMAFHVIQNNLHLQINTHTMWLEVLMIWDIVGNLPTTTLIIQETLLLYQITTINIYLAIPRLHFLSKMS